MAFGRSANSFQSRNCVVCSILKIVWGSNFSNVFYDRTCKIIKLKIILIWMSAMEFIWSQNQKKNYFPVNIVSWKIKLWKKWTYLDLNIALQLWGRRGWIFLKKKRKNVFCKRFLSTLYHSFLMSCVCAVFVNIVAKIINLSELFFEKI